MKKTAIIISIALLSACSVKLLTITQADAERGATKFPETTMASLNEGKMLYVQNCGKCHGLKAPESKTEAQWNKIVPVMARKAKVDSRTQDLILKYVVTMSEAKRPAKK